MGKLLCNMETSVKRRSLMNLEETSMRRLVLLATFVLGTFAAMTRLAAAQTPSPALLFTISNRGKGEYALGIADPLTMKVVGRVPIADNNGHPHEVAVSDDGKFAFVTNTAYPREISGQAPLGVISVIDLVAQKEVHRVEIGPNSIPHGIVFVGGKVYFTAEGYQLIGRYNPATNKIDWMFGTGHSGTHMLVVSKDAKKIFTGSTDSNNVIVIEPWDHRDYKYENHIGGDPWMATLIPVGKGPEGIGMSPDEKEVWVPTKRDSGLSIINVATKKVSQTLNLLNTKTPERIKFTRDGRRVLISDGDAGTVLVLDAVTRKEIKRFDVGVNPHGIAIAPDGSRAYVTVEGASEALTVKSSTDIVVIDLKTLELKGRIPCGLVCESVVWAETK
jgi:YVTN family beta-propeller protein